MKEKFDFDKEWEKLMDLEFDYNLARLTRQDEDIIKVAKAKYTRQENKIKNMQRIASDEQKEGYSINAPEKDKSC